MKLVKFYNDLSMNSHFWLYPDLQLIILAADAAAAEMSAEPQGGFMGPCILTKVKFSIHIEKKGLSVCWVLCTEDDHACYNGDTIGNLIDGCSCDCDFGWEGLHCNDKSNKFFFRIFENFFWFFQIQWQKLFTKFVRVTLFLFNFKLCKSLILITNL